MKRSGFRRGPYRVKRKKSLLKSRILRFLVMIAFLFCGISYLLFLSPLFKIKDIQVSGNEKISQDTILAKIKNEISGGEGNNIFLFSPAAAEDAFLKAFPDIADIEVKKSLPDGLKIKVEERKPVAIFCQQSNCFNLDKDGILFTRDVNSQTDFPEIGSQLFTQEAKPGDKALTSDLLSQILSINDKLNGLKISVNNFSLVSEQRLNVKTQESWSIYFNLMGDIDWQIKELTAVLNAKIPPQKRGNLQYIDLRFDKVFIYPEIK